MKPLPKFDVGLIWAKVVNIWGQLGTVAGAVNVVMMVFVFYSTTIKPNIPIPLWLYLVLIGIGAAAVIWFILRWGISGYYRFFSNQSELTAVNRKVDLIMEHLKIENKKPD